MSIEELKSMPVVTVEQIARFREAALSEIKALKLDLGLLRISYEHSATLLESCEKALARDQAKLLELERVQSK